MMYVMYTAQASSSFKCFNTHIPHLPLKLKHCLAPYVQLIFNRIH